MDEDLTGRCAHVTGAARGIGLAVAKRLAASGARVALSDVNEEGAKAAAAELGDQHLGLGCDVRSMSEVQAAMNATTEAFGQLDILVNNAGIEIGAPLHETSEEQFTLIFDINVVGVQRCTQAALPALLASKGNIVNMSSVAGLGGAPLLGAYCGTKAAVLRMTETYATELKAHGVRVNAVCPAFVDTVMVERLAPKVAAVTGLDFADVAKIKQGRMGTVEEVAEVVAFLASDEAAWTTGAHYVLDGGLTGSLL
ncbi:SDR family NAD(P)-dependent oxidoreductase [Conexibacter sp. SYSU D00693]|uniref:SDR family NAD(P)-dependent oxidoreductase n=1 Tax=Conexibacter sp. SYSU D00693 TaxID=2812560 RepID=UPI00196A23D7|nr:SDR family oxidoreductase [Conexibacter sp. SYSU D00693]